MELVEEITDALAVGGGDDEYQNLRAYLSQILPDDGAVVLPEMPADAWGTRYGEGFLDCRTQIESSGPLYRRPEPAISVDAVPDEVVRRMCDAWFKNEGASDKVTVVGEDMDDMRAAIRFYEDEYRSK